MLTSHFCQLNQILQYIELGACILYMCIHIYIYIEIENACICPHAHIFKCAQALVLDELMIWVHQKEPLEVHLPNGSVQKSCFQSPLLERCVALLCFWSHVQVADNQINACPFWSLRLVEASWEQMRRLTVLDPWGHSHVGTSTPASHWKSHWFSELH